MKIYLLDLDSLEYSTHSVKQFIELFNVEESLSNDTRVFTNLKKLKKFLKDYTWNLNFHGLKKLLKLITHRSWKTPQK